MDRKYQVNLWRKAKDTITRVNGSFGIRASEDLARLVGVSYPAAGHYLILDYPPELIRKLEMIAGPHGGAVLAVMKARKGES